MFFFFLLKWNWKLKMNTCGGVLPHGKQSEWPSNGSSRNSSRHAVKMPRANMVEANYGWSSTNYSSDQSKQHKESGGRVSHREVYRWEMCWKVEVRPWSITQPQQSACNDVCKVWGSWEEIYIPMMKPWSIALFIAHPPMPKTTPYMQKLRTKSRDAADFRAAIFSLGRAQKKDVLKDGDGGFKRRAQCRKEGGGACVLCSVGRFICKWPVCRFFFWVLFLEGCVIQRVLCGCKADALHSRQGQN